MSAENDEYDLHEAWDKACRSFAATTGIDLSQEKPKSPEAVAAQLKLKRHADEKKQADYQVLKTVVEKTLLLIQNLGGIVSSAASMVYGPSSLCFNAVSYLITAGQNYRNIFTTLTQLFNEVSDVLERFAVYLKMKEVDKPLRKIIHEILLSFVSICDLSVRVLQGNKLLKFLRVFAFNEDDGVSGAIANLRSLVERESQMKTTLTYRAVKEGFGEAQDAIAGVKASLDRMLDDTRRKESDSLGQKLLNKIKVKLGVQNGPEEQARSFRRLLADTVPGSGQWIEQNRSFLQWRDRTAAWDRVLLLSANEGYGKSFLVTTIIHNLEKRYFQPTAAQSRTSIAYHYLEQLDAGRTSSDPGMQSLIKALKTAALQLAQEPVYRKELAAICESWVEPDSPAELFGRLFEPCLRSNETFYVIFDGVDQLGDWGVKALSDLLRHMQAEHESDELRHLRILLSGRTPALATLIDTVDLKTAEIDLATSNATDIERFVADRLDRMDIFQKSSEQIRSLQQEVFLGLTQGANGDFVNVDLLLKEIGSKRWPAEVREVLVNQSQRSDTIAREIKRCNQTFQTRDIHDLNALLTWVMSAMRTLTVEELEAVLFLRNGEASLRPLYDQLCHQYSAFFIVNKPDYLEHNKASVTLVSDSIKEYFSSLVQSEQEVHEPESGKVHPAEVRIIRHFLDSVCDEDLYIKFGFEEFFQRKLSANSATINVELNKAHLQVLLDCCQIIPSYERVELQPLYDYAWHFLVDHLHQIELTAIDNNNKARVGQYLVDMFSVQDTIAKWWTADQLFDLADKWFFRDEAVDLVLGWLKDPATTKTCSPRNQAWVKTLTSNSFPEVDLLEHVAVYIADCLFRQSVTYRGHPVIMMQVLYAFLRKLHRRKDPSLAKVDFTTKLLTVKQINHISRWAAERLHVDKPDFEWTRCLARAYRVFGHYEEAVQAYKAAGELQHDHWFSDYGLATTYDDLEEWSLAAQLYQDILRRIETGEAKDPSPAEHITTLRFSLAQVLVELGEYNKAIVLYDQQLADNPSSYGVIMQKIVALRRQGRNGDIIEILKQLSSDKDPAHGISRLSMTLHTFIGDLDLHSTVLVVGNRTGTISFVQSVYRAALEEAMDPGYLVRDTRTKAEYRVVLSCELADILYKYPQTVDDREEALELWESAFLDADDIGFAPARYMAAKALSIVYYEQLRQQQKTSSPPDSPETLNIVNKLLRLSGQTKAASADNLNAMASTIDTRLLVGRHYSKVGLKKEARDCLRGHIKIGIDLLSDEDPSNDWQGYLRLASTLMYYGDKESALAAWSLIGPDEFTQQQEDGEVDDERNDGGALSVTSQRLVPPKGMEPKTPFRKPEGNLIYKCDGGTCQHMWTYANDMHICMDCLDVMFASPCHELHVRNALEIKVCDPTHEFLYVPPWDEMEAKGRGPGRVRRAGTTVPVSDWISEIRREWSLG
ncbi:hypothetical protein ABEF95_011185 [Exophiala dermatitidis]